MPGKKARKGGREEESVAEKNTRNILPKIDVDIDQLSPIARVGKNDNT